jgi:transcriptional regulator with XRE-family HTH domain
MLHMSTVVKNFGKAVRNIRASNGWSQAELGARVGVTAGYVSLVERAKKDVNLETVARFADALGLDILFGEFRLTAKTGPLRGKQ